MKISPQPKISLATTGTGVARAAIRPDGQWEVQPLLSDQDVRCLASDPLQPGVLYAGTQGNGLLRSTDCGKTWAPRGLDGHIIKSVSASRLEPGVIYAGTKPAGIFLSRDGGASWRELDSFQRIPGRWFWFSPAEPPFQAYVQAIVLSPSDPNVIIAGIEAGAVVHSVDGGQTWTGHRPRAVRDCHSLFFHPFDGRWVYEGGGGGAAFSQDGGRTWRQPKDGLDRRYCWAVAADPARPEVWYVSAAPLFTWSKPGVPPAHIDGQANAAIYRSAGGAPWQKLGDGLPDPLTYMPYALLIDPAAPGQLYAGLSDGSVWFSPDYGEAWERLPFNFGGIHRTLIIF